MSINYGISPVRKQNSAMNLISRKTSMFDKNELQTYFKNFIDDVMDK